MLLTDKLRRQEKMSGGEKSIADYVLSLGRKLEKYSTRNLADSTYTSPSTVIRLCKKVGYSGFDEFKKQFLEELNYLEQDFGSVDVNFPFSAEDTASKATKKICSLYEETVKDTLSIMRYDMLQKAVMLLKRCDTIYIFSAGTAMNHAEAFKEKMMKIGRNVVISNNLNYQLYEASCIRKKDCALLISYSGETDKILMVAKTCQEKGVPIIAFTSLGENSLSKLAACKLLISTRESMFYNIADFSSHVSINLLLDILYSVYFLQNYEENYQNKLDLVQHMEKLRSSTNPYLAKNDKK